MNAHHAQNRPVLHAKVLIFLALTFAARVVEAGDTVTFNTARLFLKGVSLLSTTSTSRVQLADVIELVRARKLRPIITERFPLDDAPRVHRLMVDRKLSGRVVLLP